MNHRSLVQLHGYIAVLFLPFAILFAVTGALYIVGQSGETDVRTLRVSLPHGRLG